MELPDQCHGRLRWQIIFPTVGVFLIGIRFFAHDKGCPIRCGLQFKYRIENESNMNRSENCPTGLRISVIISSVVKFHLINWAYRSAA